jgi:hypothetical protein
MGVLIFERNHLRARKREDLDIFWGIKKEEVHT